MYISSIIIWAWTCDYYWCTRDHAVSNNDWVVTFRGSYCSSCRLSLWECAAWDSLAAWSKAWGENWNSGNSSTALMMKETKEIGAVHSRSELLQYFSSTQPLSTGAIIKTGYSADYFMMVKMSGNDWAESEFAPPIPVEIYRTSYSLLFFTKHVRLLSV